MMIHYINHLRKHLVHETYNATIVYFIESATYGVLITSCLHEKYERASHERALL